MQTGVVSKILLHQLYPVESTEGGTASSLPMPSIKRGTKGWNINVRPEVLFSMIMQTGRIQQGESQQVAPLAQTWPLWVEWPKTTRAKTVTYSNYVAPGQAGRAAMLFLSKIKIPSTIRYSKCFKKIDSDPILFLTPFYFFIFKFIVYILIQLCIIR